MLKVNMMMSHTLTLNMKVVTRLSRSIYYRSLGTSSAVAVPALGQSSHVQYQYTPAVNYLTKSLAESFPKVTQHVATVQPKLSSDFLLHSGKTLPKESIQIKYATFGDPAEYKRILLLCPSMSNSVYAMDEQPSSTQDTTNNSNLARGWWRGVIGYGSHFGIDLNKFFVICASPLGSPFGSTSPVTINPNTGKRFGPDFPQITPADQAKLHALLLDHLNIPKVFAVVGGSMGGMQSIQFAALYPERYDLFASIASTAQTTPGIVALRYVQRQAVRMDPEFHAGKYYEKEFNSKGPHNGLRVARMFGTICYRSHVEFVERFDWLPSKQEDDENSFEIERYLTHQADIFISRSNYDANCYLLMSKSMDLMNAYNSRGIEGKPCITKIPSSKQALLLSYSTDKLTPPEDLARLGSDLGANNVSVHYEVLESTYGHDAFLIERESGQLNMRLKAFLEGGISYNGVHAVHKLVKELLHD